MTDTKRVSREPDKPRELLRETVDALENAATWADDSDDPDGEDAARHFRVIANRARAYLAAQDQPQAAPMRVVVNPGVPPDTIQFRDSNSGKLLGAIRDATPAAEPDVERRVRELAESVPSVSERSFADEVADVLRQFGAEQRAAEREACAKVADEYPKKAAARMEMMPTEEMRTTGIGIAAVIRSRHD